MAFGDSIRKALAVLTPRQEKLLRMIHGIGEKSVTPIECAASEFAMTLVEAEREYYSALKVLKKLHVPSEPDGTVNNS
jgi:hypothetical protein